MMHKNECKNYVKTNWNKNLTDKNKAYIKNKQLLRIMKERLLTYISLDHKLQKIKKKLINL